jgi:hypothetical protein
MAISVSDCGATLSNNEDGERLAPSILRYKLLGKKHVAKEQEHGRNT